MYCVITITLPNPEIIYVISRLLHIIRFLKMFCITLGLRKFLHVDWTEQIYVSLTILYWRYMSFLHVDDAS